MRQVLHCIALHCIVLHCIALHCIVLYCIVLHCIALYCIVLYCLYCIVLRCSALYCIVLHCSVLYCIVLYNSDWSEHIVSQVSVRFAISFQVCTPPKLDGKSRYIAYSKYSKQQQQCQMLAKTGVRLTKGPSPLNSDFGIRMRNHCSLFVSERS